jgi:uncharacterized protein
MAAAYFDTSAVVAFYVPEPLSDHVQVAYRSHASRVISDLVEVEFYSALSLRLRIGSLERTEVDRIAQLFRNHVQRRLYDRFQLHAGHYRLARDFIARFDLPLKVPGALHLAICTSEGLTLITGDEQLARNAQTLNIGHELIEP